MYEIIKKCKCKCCEISQQYFYELISLYERDFRIFVMFEKPCVNDEIIEICESEVCDVWER